MTDTTEIIITDEPEDEKPVLRDCELIVTEDDFSIQSDQSFIILQPDTLTVEVRAEEELVFYVGNDAGLKIIQAAQVLAKDPFEVGSQEIDQKQLELFQQELKELMSKSDYPFQILSITKDYENSCCSIKVRQEGETITLMFFFSKEEELNT